MSNLSEDLFFFGLHLIMGRKTDFVSGWKIFILVFIILKFFEFPGILPFENPANATGSSPSCIANPGFEPNQTPSFLSFILCPIKSPSFQKLLMMSLHDLRFSPPPNSKSRLRLCIKPCAICIPDTGL